LKFAERCRSNVRLDETTQSQQLIHLAHKQDVRGFPPMKISRLLSLLAVLAFSAATTQAANITWGSATNITGDSDVSTNGTLVGAFNIGDLGVANTTVNGTLFTALPVSGTSVTSGNFTLSGGNLHAINSAGSGVAPFSLLSTQYQALLSSVGVSLSGFSITLVMSGLVVGATYEFQWWSNRSNEFVTTTTATAGGSVTLSSNTTGLAGGLGQFAIGTFIADSASQQITFPGDVLHQELINGFQLRQLGQVTVPDTGSTALLLSLALLAFVGLSWKKARRQEA